MRPRKQFRYTKLPYARPKPLGGMEDHFPIDLARAIVEAILEEPDLTENQRLDIAIILGREYGINYGYPEIGALLGDGLSRQRAEQICVQALAYLRDKRGMVTFHDYTESKSQTSWDVFDLYHAVGIGDYNLINSVRDAYWKKFGKPKVGEGFRRLQRAGAMEGQAKKRKKVAA